MIEYDLESVWNGFKNWFSYLFDVWETWSFYLIGYLFVLYFANKILSNVSKKVEESKKSNARYKDIYPAIQSSIIELKKSETQIFFLFIAGILMFALLNKLFIPLNSLDSIPREQTEIIDTVSFGMFFVYKFFINVMPNYSRYKTYKQLSKNLK